MKCEERTVGCHVDCKKYKEYKKENEKTKKNKIEVAINRSTIFRPQYMK